MAEAAFHLGAGGPGAAAVAALAAAAASAAASGALARALTPAVADLLSRRGVSCANHEGRILPCGVGLVFLAAAVPAYAALMLGRAAPREEILALLAAAAIMAAAGLVDDLRGGEPKGLRGHLAALRVGVVTSGAAKAAAGLMAGLVAAAALPAGAGERFTTLLLVPLCANAVNVLDLRPGRAGKAFVLAAAAELAATGGLPHLAPLAGAVAGYLRYDLRGAAMMGDAGANLLGAALGVALAQDLGAGGEALAVAVLAALHVLVERVSLSALIDSRPLLRRFDAWGRPRGG